MDTGNWISAIGILVLIGGWFINSYLTSERDANNRQREMIVAYRVEAYQNLALSSNRNLTDEYEKKLESAVANIQLLGTPEEIQAVSDFLERVMNSTKNGGRPCEASGC